MARKGKLTDDAQRHVVTALACFERPSAVVASLKREFGISVTAQSIEAYDPTKRAGHRLAAQWRTIFEETRRRFLQETADIGIAHKAVRLRCLQRMADAAEKKKHFALAAQLLEQAAKEVGNAYTNTRVISGPHGKPIQVQKIEPAMSVQQAAELWQQAMASGPAW